MSVLDSLLVDAFGLSIVFAVLISLSLIIKLITRIFSRLEKRETESNKTHTEQQSAISPAEARYADGELKLFEVDEKTAALIMAIVSDESNIPLSELHFKSIRLMKQEAK